MKPFAGILALVVSGQLFAAVQINGAGASFPYPLYSKWFSEYQKVNKEVQFNYQSIGSGGGIKQFTEKTVDFGATDAPMSEEELAKAGAPVLHIPTVLGAVVVTYNLPGNAKGLKLTGELVSEIFLGKVTKWSDSKIKALNPSLNLTGDILVIHRADGSGTTAIFTDYLAKVSSEWKEKVGAGKAVSWPVGIGGKGNEGVAGAVKQTLGSIGYVELIYAENNQLAYADIKNTSGAFVKASMKSVSKAAEGALASMPDDFRVSITNSAGKEAYPISSFTYLLVYQSQTDAVKGPKVVEFLKWSMKDGQGYAEKLFYAPLPKKLIEKVDAKLKTIQVKAKAAG